MELNSISISLGTSLLVPSVSPVGLGAVAPCNAIKCYLVKELNMINDFLLRIQQIIFLLYTLRAINSNTISKYTVTLVCSSTADNFNQVLLKTVICY